MLNTSDFARDAALWGAALLGFYGLWRRSLSHRGETTLWLAATFAMTVPGFFFRPHYFLRAIPFLGLLAALFARECGTILRENGVRLPNLAPQILGVLAVITTLIFHRAVLFELMPDAASRRIYRGEMFVEARAIGLKLRAQMAPNARLAIFGSEPQIAFYALRRMAAEFLYTYNLVERQPFAAQMQRTLAAQIERAADFGGSAKRSFLGRLAWQQPFHFSLAGRLQTRLSSAKSDAISRPGYQKISLDFSLATAKGELISCADVSLQLKGDSKASQKHSSRPINLRF